MNRVRVSSLPFGAISVAAQLMCIPGVNGQTMRSTHYDDTSNGWVRFEDQPQFDATVAMTIEAWVYREPNSGRETIVSHHTNFNSGSSYFFGFQDDFLLFKRGGTESAQSTTAVPDFNWTHVAVTYDGTTARFYVDGNSAGSASITNAGVNADRPLTIGARATTVSYPPMTAADTFKGYIDELRIWSLRRTQSQIQNGRFRELRAGTGLVAAFPEGGDREELANLTADSGSGADQAVLGLLPRDLLIPRTNLTPCIGDGTIDFAGAYANAEQLVVYYDSPAPSSDPDAIAYFVHTDTDLYIAVRQIGGTLVSNSWIAVLLDPNGSRDPLAQSTDIQLKARWTAQPEWLIGDGAGAYEVPPTPVLECSGICPATCTTWQHELVSCDGEFAHNCHEFRIPRSRLGASFTEQDVLAIGHFWFDNVTGRDFFGPSDANWNQPATWATVNYSSNAATIPRVRMSGHVYDRSALTAIANHPVYLKNASSGSVYAHTNTLSNGSFSFYDIFVPSGVQLALQIPDCETCRVAAFPPIIGSGTPRPVSVAPYDVIFPACAIGNSPCTYPSVDFHLRPARGTITITGSDTDEGRVQIVLRENPPKNLDATEVTLFGTNFNDSMTVWFREEDGLFFNDVEAEILSLEVDGTSVKVRISAIPDGWPIQSHYNGHWRIYDPAAGGVWQPSAYVAGPAFVLRRVPSIVDYPMAYGFEFENEGDSPTWSEYQAVFGRSAFICLGITYDGDCLGCEVMGPLYLAYYPIYTDILDAGRGGSCVGMSATSLRFFHGSLDANTFDSEVHYPNGLPGNPSPLAPKPARYESQSCGPDRAENLWAQIRKEHGVQFSEEVILEVIDDLAGLGLTEGDPSARLSEVDFYPTGYVLSMSNALGEGHGVVPYRVEQNPSNPNIWWIYVYDNNHADDNTRKVEINTATNNFNYDGGSTTYSGRGLFTLPISLWEESHHRPQFELVLGLVTWLVFGNADMQVTTPQGEWGWDENGNFSNTLQGVVAMPPLTGGTGDRTIPILLPFTLGTPSVQINSEGGSYGWYVGHGGRLFKVEVSGTASGSIDGGSLSYDGEAIRSIGLRPGAARDHLLASVGMTLPGDRQSAVFKWSGLQNPGNAEMEFVAHVDEYGAAYRNGTNTPTKHVLVIDMVDGPSSTAATQVFGPFDVPPGATHITKLENWPATGTLRVEMDLGSNGTIDQSTVVSGRVLPWPPVGEPADKDLNGIDDSFDRRCDMNVDGDVDIPDWTTMFGCVAGPIVPVGGVPCERGDVNFDTFLDMVDILSFQRDFVGPKGNHDCCATGGAGCLNGDVQACVCAGKPSCCNSSWTDQCVAAVELLGCGACLTAHDCCTVGTRGCNNALIEECVCEADPFCCETSWDAQCVDEVSDFQCGACGPTHDCCAIGAPGCSNTAVQDCVCEMLPSCCQFGWDEGCIANVEGLSCGTCPPTHDCCVVGTAGCDDPDVAACVCAANPACCQGSWTSACVSLVNSAGCGLCTGSTHNCCTTGTAGCNNLATEDCVCAYDPYCCTNSWDALCVDLVNDLGCGLCGTEHSCCVGGGPGCADSAIESCVCATNPHCCDTSWDANCIESVEGLGCSDCNFATHSCCQTGSLGCSNSATAACVCERDPYCCSNQWDSICVDEVELFGCGYCGTHSCCATGGPGCWNEAIMQCVCSLDSSCCGSSWDSLCVTEVESFECGTCP